MPSAFVRSFRVCVCHLWQRVTHLCFLWHTSSQLSNNSPQSSIYLLPFSIHLQDKTFPIPGHIHIKSRQFLPAADWSTTNNDALFQKQACIFRPTFDSSPRFFGSSSHWQCSSKKLGISVLAETFNLHRPLTCSAAGRDPWTKFSSFSGRLTKASPELTSHSCKTPFTAEESDNLTMSFGGIHSVTKAQKILHYWLDNETSNIERNSGKTWPPSPLFFLFEAKSDLLITTPAHFPDCSRNFIEVGFQVFRFILLLCTILPNFGIHTSGIALVKIPQENVFFEFVPNVVFRLMSPLLHLLQDFLRILFFITQITQKEISWFPCPIIQRQAIQFVRYNHNLWFFFGLSFQLSS